MADPWGFLSLSQIQKEIENLASAISKEELEKNLITVFEDLKNNKDINALLGLGSKPSMIEGAEPASATTQAPSRSASASTVGSSAPALKKSASAPVLSQTPSVSSQVSSTQAPASAKTLSRASSTPVQSQTPSVSSKGSSDSVKVAPALSRSASTSSQKSDVSSNNSNESSASLGKRMGSFRSSVSSILGSVSSENSSKSKSNIGTSSRTPSTSSSRTSSRDNLRQEGEGSELPFLKRVSSGLSKGLSMCKSSLSSSDGAGVYVGLKITRKEEIVFQKEEKLRLLKTPSFNQVSSGLASGASGLASGASGLASGASRLGRTLSNKLGKVSEGVNELRRESSSVGDSFRSVRDILGSLGDFRSGSESFPSSIPSPRSWTNPLSGMSGVSSSNYKQDAKATLKNTRDLVGAASSQTRKALGSFASRVRRSTSGLSASAWLDIR
jgi:hypothetical protein